MEQNKSKSESAVDTLEIGDTTENKKKGVDWGLVGLTVFTLAYILSPIDIIPESLLGPLGFADDAALIAYLVKRIIDKIRK